MMFSVDMFSVASDHELRAKVLRLPYRGGAAMLIVLPDLYIDYTTIDDEIDAVRFLSWIKNMNQK